MSFLDNIWALKILGMLITPFDETKAYKLGIIDEKGNTLISYKDLNTTEEKKSFDMLDRLVFNIKKIINKLPGGEHKLKNMTAAYFLIKEAHMNQDYNISDELITEAISSNLITEDYEYIYSLIESLMEDAPVNSTGPMVSTDKPKIDGDRKRKKKKYKFVKRNEPID